MLSGRGTGEGPETRQPAVNTAWLQTDQVQTSKDEGQGHRGEEGKEEENERGTVEVEWEDLVTNKIRA